MELNEERYSKYKEILIKNMIIDLHRLGINNFKDKKQIFSNIQMLVNDKHE